MWVGRAEEFARPEFATSGLPTIHPEAVPLASRDVSAHT
jgi:hypothetical protein